MFCCWSNSLNELPPVWENMNFFPHGVFCHIIVLMQCCICANSQLFQMAMMMRCQACSGPQADRRLRLDWWLVIWRSMLNMTLYMIFWYFEQGVYRVGRALECSHLLLSQFLPILPLTHPPPPRTLSVPADTSMWPEWVATSSKELGLCVVFICC